MRFLSCLVAMAMLGTCHNNHRDVSPEIRSSRTIQIKDSSERVLKAIRDGEMIEQVASFMAEHADSWSGEEVFGTVPPAHLLLDFLNEKGQLLTGLGIGDESLWVYPSKGVWRRLSRRDRDRLLAILGISPESVPGLRQVQRRL